MNGFRIVTIALLLSFFLFVYELGELKNYTVSALHDNMKRDRGEMLWNRTRITKQGTLRKWVQEMQSSLYFTSSITDVDFFI